jgi:hypothetical protein
VIADLDLDKNQGGAKDGSILLRISLGITTYLKIGMERGSSRSSSDFGIFMLKSSISLHVEYWIIGGGRTVGHPISLGANAEALPVLQFEA